MRRFIIDCDTGVDDAVALLLACDCPDIDLLAITCVRGNCSLDRAVRNTCITLKAANRQVPVYRGCCQPISSCADFDDLTHGSDGLSGVSDLLQPQEGCVQSGHAANKLVEIVNHYPGEVTLIALGPLTNVALAFRLDEGFSSKLKKLVIMGGNTEGKGNVLIAGEFNFSFDPQAAQIVVEEVQCECQLVSWETCGLNHTMTYDWFGNWISHTSERGKFLHQILAKFVETKRKRNPEHGIGLCDALAVAVALYPELVVRSIRRKCLVETGGRHTRGMLAVESRIGHITKDIRPIELVEKVDMDRYVPLLDKLIL